MECLPLWPTYVGEKGRIWAKKNFFSKSMISKPLVPLGFLISEKGF
jgi:hypothetical protein